MRLSARGLHPSHFAALRTEILRTGAELSQEQLLDLTDALHSLIRLRRPGRPIRRVDPWVEYEPRTLA
ncbi:MAG: hypothetical protein Q8O54_00505 [Brevundimonas sp.]|nr:hypothetical protein [Brevundimonas sp.]